jgi:hypothetical protein
MQKRPVDEIASQHFERNSLFDERGRESQGVGFVLTRGE